MQPKIQNAKTVPEADRRRGLSPVARSLTRVAAGLKVKTNIRAGCRKAGGQQ
jgi:hypothetical protein